MLVRVPWRVLLALVVVVTMWCWLLAAVTEAVVRRQRPRHVLAGVVHLLQSRLGFGARRLVVRFGARRFGRHPRLLASPENKYFQFFHFYIHFCIA